MNSTILKKCIDELSKTEPNFGYIRGMLEAMLDMQETKPIPMVYGGKLNPVIRDSEISEAEIMDAKAKAAIETVKSMGHLS